MHRLIRSLLIAAVPLAGIGVVAMAASAGKGKTCRELLWFQTYQCEFVLEGEGVSHPMMLEFSAPESGGPHYLPYYAGPEPGLGLWWSGPHLGGGGFGWCACKTLAGNVNKPDKIKFQRKKDFHCLMNSGGDFMIGEFVADLASVEGQVRGKKIKKGEAVDVFGRHLAFGCELDGPR